MRCYGVFYPVRPYSVPQLFHGLFHVSGFPTILLEFRQCCRTSTRRSVGQSSGFPMPVSPGAACRINQLRLDELIWFGRKPSIRQLMGNSLGNSSELSEVPLFPARAGDSVRSFGEPKVCTRTRTPSWRGRSDPCLKRGTLQSPAARNQSLTITLDHIKRGRRLSVGA
jgi:hypothetical protein